MDQMSEETLLASVTAVQRYGSQAAAAEALGLAQSTVSQHLKRARALGLYREHGGTVNVLEVKAAALPEKGTKRVFFLSCVQDHTRLHDDALENILALVSEDDATLMVSAFKYNKDAQGQRAMSKSDADPLGGKHKKRKPPEYTSRQEELEAEYPHAIIPYICDDRVQLAPNLVFCGELNVLPTATHPLEGLENYTFRASTIVPHPKVEMKSIPTMKSEGVKLMFTTGCLTQRNYIKRKVGYKAEHFHTYGALIVEVDENGSWWCRQVTQGPDGTMYDMNRRARGGKVEYQKKEGGYVENITWGDIHATKLDDEVAEASFGSSKDSMLEVLRPKSQHVHDVMDFSGRSHHTRKDPWEVYRSHKQGQWELTPELVTTANVLWNRISRPWCETFVVNSNHDRHLDTFCKFVDWREDPINAKMLLSLNLMKLESIEKDEPLNLMEVALNLGLDRLKDMPNPTHTARNFTNPVTFLAEDESHVILPKIDGGIECGLHGDRGSNGAKGSLATFAKLDRKTNSADKHFTGIQNHAYQAGLTGKLDMGYNHGLSSWTHGHIVTYANGTRAIYSIWKGKWRA